MSNANQISNSKKKKFKLNPLAVITLSFLVLILIGSLLLYLPISKKDQSISFFDCLFLSTSSITVSGLNSMNKGLAESFTLFGLIVQIILVQIGGIGVATIAIMFFMIASNNLSFKEQALIKESWNLNNFKQIRKVLLFVFLETIIVELIGAFSLFFDFKYIQNFDSGKAIGYAFYFSISAFNNSGFDLFGTNSLMNYSSDYYLLIVLAILIIIGGLGFLVNVEILKKKFNFKKFSLQTKIVLTYSFALTILGSLLIYIFELINHNSNISYLGSLFMSVSTRTAGFSLYDLRTFNDATLIVIAVLMFIGAAPGGTGAGIKVTTFACLILYLRSVITNKSPHAFKRGINSETIRKALLIILITFFFFLFGFMLISLFEGNYRYIDLSTGMKYVEFQEGCVSYNALDFAFLSIGSISTTGLTTGIVPYLTIGSKIVVMIMIFIGRVGPMTISRIFTGNDTSTYRLVDEDIAIG